MENDNAPATIDRICTQEEFLAKSPTSQMALILNAAVRLISLKGGDYVDPDAANGMCSYIKDGAPSCIAGHILHAVGWDVATLASTKGSVQDNFPGLVPSWQAVVLLATMQNVQDNGGAWRQGVDAAQGAYHALRSCDV